MILSDEIIAEISAVMHKIEQEKTEWHELSERERELLNIHFSIIADFVNEAMKENQTDEQREAFEKKHFS